MFPVFTSYINCSNAASSGGLDCVHLLDPGVSNTSMIVAGGARDQLIYLWRLRHPENNSESETEERRTLRSNTRTCLKGHMVCIKGGFVDSSYKMLRLYNWVQC